MKAGWIALGGVAALVGVGIALVSSRSLADDAPTGVVLKSGDKALLVGDSLAVGLDAPLSLALKAKGVTLVTLAKTGVTAKGLLPMAKANAALLPGVRVVFVSLGSNDAALSDPTIEAQDLIDLVTLLGSQGAMVVWLEPPNFLLDASSVPAPATRAKQQTFTTMMTKTSAGDALIPSSAVMAQLGGDRVHLSTYATFAQQVADYGTQ